MCEKTVQDIVERFWDIVEELSINRVLSVLRDNLVGAVIITSAIVWIPASCLISWVRPPQRVCRVYLVFLFLPRVSPGCTGSYWVLLGSSGFYWI